MASVLLIGTGRLAFHLGHALKGAGTTLAGVAGRNAEHAASLAAELGCRAVGLGRDLPPADLRILAVSDDAIGAVARNLPDDGTPVIHLSGTKSLDLLAPHAHRGMLWPIQSFTAGGPPVDLGDVPLVIDAGDDGTLLRVRSMAEGISRHVVHLPFALRQRLHLSAVMASNFPVFLLREAERLLAAHGIDPKLLHPLWRQSTGNALRDADAAVSGPARRGDGGTIHRHLELLADEPELRRAYEALSNLILHTYHPESRGRQDL